MNTIGAAIDRGEIEVKAIRLEGLGDYHVPPCGYCKFLSMDESGMICTLFDSPYNSIELEPSTLTSSASLVSVIISCTLKEEGRQHDIIGTV